MTDKNLTTYLVGGAVRDFAMGLRAHDSDYVVIGSTEQEMLDLGFTQVGKDFPVFLHPLTKHEYALARKERKTAKGHGGFEVITSNVTLEEDLMRRDFTMNAMALRDTGDDTNPYEVIDPFGGNQDIRDNILRHVNEATFVEDPLRVLRAARFLARYKDLKPHQDLLELCCEMVSVGMLQELSGDRIWKEISRGIMEPHPRRMFEFLLEIGALGQIAPELARLKGVPQVAMHHPEICTFEHTMLCVEEAVKIDASLTVRMTVLLHDLGKGTTRPEILPKHIAHEERGVKLIDELCQRWKTPKVIRTTAMLMSREHTNVHRIFAANKTTIIKTLERLGGLHRREHLQSILRACKCDALGRLGKSNDPYPQADFLLQLQEAVVKADLGKIAAKFPEGLSLQKRKQIFMNEYIRLARPVFAQYEAAMLSTKTYPFFAELCHRYVEMLAVAPQENNEDPTSSGHLVWMLKSLQRTQMENTKKHRWLGYVQGVMVSKGLLKVNEEREATREVFAGR